MKEFEPYFMHIFKVKECEYLESSSKNLRFEDFIKKRRIKRDQRYISRGSGETIRPMNFKILHNPGIISYSAFSSPFLVCRTSLFLLSGLFRISLSLPPRRARVLWESRKKHSKLIFLQTGKE